MNPILATTLALVTAVAACSDDRKKAARDIESWGTRWERERECLLGAAPPARDAREAFMVRAISAGGAKALVTDCLRDTALLRDADARVDDQSVEAAWQDLNRAVESMLGARRELANGNEDAAASMSRRIAAVDSIYARLRKRAGMSPVVLPGSPLPDEPDGVVIGRSGNGDSFATPLLSGDGIAIYQTSNGSTSVTAVRGPTDIDRYPTTDVLPAAGDDPWGVRVVPGPKWIELQLTDGTVIAKEPAREVHSIEPKFASSGPDRRAVVYELRRRLPPDDEDAEWPPPIAKVVASTGGAWKPALTAEGTPEGAYVIWPYVYVDWPRRRADIVWGDAERKLHWATLRAGELAAPVRRPAGEVSHYYDLDPVACFGEQRAWILSDKKLWLARGDDAPAAEVPGYVHGEATIKCNDDQLVRVWQPDDAWLFQRCTPEGCTRPRTADATGSIGLGRDGRTATAFAAQGVMFLHVEGDAPRPAWRIGADSTVYGILQAADGWHAIVIDLRGVRLVPLGG